MKTNRSVSRLAVVQALYQKAMTDDGYDKIVKDFLAGNVGREVISENPYTDKEEYVPVMPMDETLFTGLMNAYIARRTDIDDMISACMTDNWTKERTEVLFWSILSAGVAELLAYPQTPVAVIVNEYVDLTEAFYGAKSHEVSVANGIFRRISNDVREDA